VAFFTPPDSGALRSPVVFTAFEVFSRDSKARFKLLGSSAFASGRCFAAGEAAACCMLPSWPLDVLAVPLLLLPLLVRRGCATCTGAGTCLLVRLKGMPRLLPAIPLPVSKLSIAATLTGRLDVEQQLQL
jgi:hypothetical protein